MSDNSKDKTEVKSPATDQVVDGQEELDRSERNGLEEKDNAEPAVDEKPDLEQETKEEGPNVEELRKELETTQDKLLRLAAEYQNYRRRTEQEKTSLVELGKILVVQELLDVLDDFDRTKEVLESTEEANAGDNPEVLKQGFLLIHRKLLESLEKIGLEPIEAVGKPFNVDDHEAMMQQPAPDGTEKGVVLSEFQKGYRLGNRVIRHSKVVVSV
jgi:molecular chaperone GrpE